MLSWIQDEDGWVANGYRIRLVRPFHWDLLDDITPTGAVFAEPTPLATTRTLSACKREAELLETASRANEIRRRSWGLLVLALTGFFFVPSFNPPAALVAFLTLLAVASRAAGLIAGSYMARSHLTADNLFYQ